MLVAHLCRRLLGHEAGRHFSLIRWTFIQRIAVGATVEPVAPCSFSGCITNANS
jgi:hypothetical protein